MKESNDLFRRWGSGRDVHMAAYLYFKSTQYSSSLRGPLRVFCCFVLWRVVHLLIIIFADGLLAECKFLKSRRQKPEIRYITTLTLLFRKRTRCHRSMYSNMWGQKMTVKIRIKRKCTCFAFQTIILCFLWCRDRVLPEQSIFIVSNSTQLERDWFSNVEQTLVMNFLALQRTRYCGWLLQISNTPTANFETE